MAESRSYSLTHRSSSNGLRKATPGDPVTLASLPALGGRPEERESSVADKKATLLMEVNTLLAESDAPEPVLKKIVAGLREWDPSIQVSVYRLNRQERLLHPVMGMRAADQGAGLALPADGPKLVAQVVRSGRSASIPGSDGKPKPLGGQLPSRAEYAVPLRAGGNVLGALFHTGYCF